VSAVCLSSTGFLVTLPRGGQGVRAARPYRLVVAAQAGEAPPAPRLAACVAFASGLPAQALEDERLAAADERNGEIVDEGEPLAVLVGPALHHRDTRDRVFSGGPGLPLGGELRTQPVHLLFRGYARPVRRHLLNALNDEGEPSCTGP
jgi:hypothetical protein